jgi:hypothetical protein
MGEKREMQNRLNQSLSGLKEDPFLAQRVIAQGKGEPEMKKKISFAFVLAMVLLLLLTVVAVAEVLGVNVFEVFGKTAPGMRSLRRILLWRARLKSA